jgi:hypothetical protein
MSLTDVRLDRDGHIIPTRTALAYVEQKYPAESDADKYRLACAQTLLDARDQEREQTNAVLRRTEPHPEDDD